METLATKYVLTLDIGGTNPRMAMVEIIKNNTFKILDTVNITKTNSSVIPDINTFLKACAEKNWTTNTCIASVAGPINIENNSCEKPTNIHFPIRGSEIKEQTLLTQVLVVNDFRAIGEAVSTINFKDTTASFKKICTCKEAVCKETPCQNIPPASLGNRAVIGPGTGLGIAYLLNNQNGFTTLSSEGGHSCVSDDVKLSELRNFIRQKLHVTQLGMEALVSGQGILHTIEFLLENEEEYLKLSKLYPNFKQTIQTIKQLPQSDQLSDATLSSLLKEDTSSMPKLIGENRHKNAKIALTLRIFFDSLGTATQGVALHGLATGGVFIAGGIVKNYIDMFEDGDFLHSFLNNWKENIKETLEKIPTYVLTDYDISFYGCAKIAQDEF